MRFPFLRSWRFFVGFLTALCVLLGVGCLICGILFLVGFAGPAFGLVGAFSLSFGFYTALKSFACDRDDFACLVIWAEDRK